MQEQRSSIDVRGVGNESGLSESCHGTTGAIDHVEYAVHFGQGIAGQKFGIVVLHAK